ncbi:MULTISPECIES: hypothetical protein [Bradyrhizobium]|uniref:hypothetical protein n=1 Tax=Bradyrhizobium TaxID=374 RepID=UPI00138AC687|nr:MULTISPECIES: hypothetical protein [Bradyrhizobium]MCA1530716.1 hypothetical protein [Bradyrhizobium yuanmingense]
MSRIPFWEHRSWCQSFSKRGNKIFNMKPAPPGVGRTVADFDLQPTDDVRLFGFKLVTGSGGQYVVHAANIHGIKAATFTRELQQKIVRAAAQAWSKIDNDERNAA